MEEDMPDDELEIYKNLYEHQGARIRFNCDQVTYEGIIDMILPQSRQVKLRHSKVIPEDEYFGNLRFRFSEVESFTVVESAEIVYRYPKNEYLLNILRNNRPHQYSISEMLYGDRLSDESGEENSINVEINEEKFIFDIPSHLKHKVPEDYSLVETFDEDFDLAINHIAQQPMIGVSFDGPVISRFGRLTWVCICTDKRVFLFDIQKLENEAFENGLQYIFENKFIKKIIHDCKFPADCLAHKYNTKLNNVFDTRVADYVITVQRCRDNKGLKYFSSLDCCLRHYLNISQEFLFKHETCQSLMNKEQFYKKRPISHAFMHDLMKSTVYLIALQRKLHKELLAPLYKNTNLCLGLLSLSCNKVIETIGDLLSIPDNIPSSLLMYGIQTARFEKSKPLAPLICNFIDPRTGEIILHKTDIYPETKNDGCIKIEKFDKESHEYSKVPIQNEDHLLQNNPEENFCEDIESLSVWPSFRQLDEMYYKLANKNCCVQLMNDADVKPSASTTFSSKETSEESSKDIWSKIRAEAFSEINTNCPKRNIKFVPG